MTGFTKAICAIAAAGTIAVATPAAAVVITFDNYAPQGQGLPNPVSIDGLDFSNSFYQAVFADGRPNANNGTAAFIYGYGTLTLTKTGGGAFTLNALDLGQSFYAPVADAISYTFNLAAGGSVSGFLASTDVFQTFTFNQTITSAVFGATDGYVAIDNLSFDAAGAVPEPASWALMLGGFGIAGAALRRRRQTVRVTYA